jgi:hypothetical protein
MYTNLLVCIHGHTKKLGVKHLSTPNVLVFSPAHTKKLGVRAKQLVYTQNIVVQSIVHQSLWCARVAYTKIYSSSSHFHTMSRNILVCIEEYTKTQLFLVCILVCSKVIK